MTTSVGGSISRLILIFFALSSINSVLTAPAKAGLCSKPMDIAFLMDVSGSIGRKNLGISKTFMEKAVDYFGMSDQGNHYAIMTFSTNPRTIVNFNTFTGKEVKSVNLKRKIWQTRIDWLGYSFIDRALIAANMKLFTVGAGMRQNALKVAFVLTDGIQTKDRGIFMSLARAGEGLRQKHVQINAVGVGNDIDILEFYGLASSASNIFNGDLSKKPKVFDDIASLLCSNRTAVPTTSTPFK